MPPKPQTQDMDIMEGILKKKKAVVTSAYIQTDGEVAITIGKLQQELSDTKIADAQSNAPDKAPAIQKKLAKAIQDGASTLVEFQFVSIGRERYDELLRECPPSASQRKEGAEMDPEKFTPLLLSEASLHPKISLEQAKHMMTDPTWNQSEILSLFWAALQANTETPDIPLFNTGSESTAALLSKLATAMKAESPTRSS